MMKIKNIAYIISIFLTLNVSAQLESGFNPREVRDMIQVCNSFAYLDLYGSDKEIIPNGYKKVYTSPALGMDNRFQVFSNGKKAIISFRGTTEKQMSWMANLYASMIPVNDKIIIDENEFNYKLGEKKDSYVHAGYTLAIYYLKNDLLWQINKLNQQGIYDFYITGHSQGGALAQLVMSYFEYLPDQELSKKNTFKVYAFANPMVGNQSFVEEYNRKFVKTGMSFIIHNPEDVVTKLPYSYQDSLFWQENLAEFLTNREGFSTRNFMIDAVSHLFSDRIISMARDMSKRIEGQLFAELGNIVMPALKEDFNYAHTGNLILISKTVYPLELKDPSILENDSLMKTYERNEDGTFKDKSLYKRRNMFLQHKPYNYYTAILKDFFPKDYMRLDKKYFE